eukprot:3386740-Alexandrium_andersonii.AAC.1
MVLCATTHAIPRARHHCRRESRASQPRCPSLPSLPPPGRDRLEALAGCVLSPLTWCGLGRGA